MRPRDDSQSPKAGERLRSLFRAASSVRIAPRATEAALLLPAFGDFEGSLLTVGRSVCVQLLSMASHLGGEVACPVRPSDLGYIARLRALGLPVFSPLLGPRAVRPRHLIIDGVDDGSRNPEGAAVPRRWRVSFDFRPGIQVGAREFVLPYTINPSLLVSGHDRLFRAPGEGSRPLRILFAGSWDAQTYDDPRFMPRLFGKMTRHAAVSAFASWSTSVWRPSGSGWHRSMPPGVRHVLADTVVARVPQHQWLSLLRMSDFMLCPPGCIMPLCHNIVEAMACGTIPITNYADWMTPPLRDGVECLSFETAEDLLGALDRARDMSPREVSLMRAACFRYYRANLDLGSCYRRLMAAGPGELLLHAVDESIARVQTMAPVARGAT